MNSSSQTTLNLNPQQPPRIPYRFLLRNIQASNHIQPLILQKVCSKRIYLKDLIIYEKEAKFQARTKAQPKEIIYRSFKSNKLFKTLQNIQLLGISQSYISESLKYSKNIKKFSISSSNIVTHPTKFSLCLRKLPVQVQKIHFNIQKTVYVPGHDGRSILKLISRFPKIENFSQPNGPASYISAPKEFKIYNQVFRRFNKMKGVDCHAGSYYDFQDVIRLNQEWPAISGLRFPILADELPGHNGQVAQGNGEKIDGFDEQFDFENLTPLQKRIYQTVRENRKMDHLGAISEQSDDIHENIQNDPSTPDSDENEFSFSVSNGDKSSLEFDEKDFRKKCRRRLHMEPFFRFGFFPNLQRLEIYQKTYYLDYCLYHLGSFVVDGFAELKNLQELKIDLNPRPQGAMYLFKAFLKLSSLKKFSLHVNFIKIEEWALLADFLEGQKALESLSLRMEEKSDYEFDKLWKKHQKFYMESLIRDLNEKPLLKSLELRSTSWRMKSLSKGFGHLQRKNQFQVLIIQTSMKMRSLTEIKGFCKFLNNQKESLKSLTIFEFPDQDVSYFTKVLAKLTQLRKLELLINSTFEPVINSLQRFENLEEIRLTFTKFYEDRSYDPSTRFVNAMRALSRLQKLRKITIRIEPRGRFIHEFEEQKMIDALRAMRDIQRDIREFEFKIKNHDRKPISLIQAIEQMNQKQSLRCDLMF